MLMLYFQFRKQSSVDTWSNDVDEYFALHDAYLLPISNP